MNISPAIEFCTDERLMELEKVVSRMTEEEQAETMYLFDEGLINCGIALSELYLSLLKLQLKSPTAIGDQFEAFREKKDIVFEERASQLRMKNRKLQIIRDAVECVLYQPADEIADILPTADEDAQMKQKLDALTKKIQFLNAQLEELRSHPDRFEGDKGDFLEWIDTAEGGEERKTFPGAVEEKPKEEKPEMDLDEFRQAGILGSSGSDLSDK